MNLRNKVFILFANNEGICTRLVRPYLTKDGNEILVNARVKDMEKTISALQSGASSVYSFKKERE